MESRKRAAEGRLRLYLSVFQQPVRAFLALIGHRFADIWSSSPVPEIVALSSLEEALRTVRHQVPMTSGLFASPRF